MMLIFLHVNFLKKDLFIQKKLCTLTVLYSTKISNKDLSYPSNGA